MYRFIVQYRHPSGLCHLGVYWGSLGSVRDDVYRDYPQIPMDSFVFEKSA